MSHWKNLDFLGYPTYCITDTGKVWSWKRGDKNRGTKPRWLQLSPVTMKKKPYQRLKIAGDWWLVHRLVLLAFVGPCPDGMEGCHDDNDPRNNCVSNLRWDTMERNQQDRVKHGTHNRGSNSTRAKLNEAAVRRIRQGSVGIVISQRDYSRRCAHKYGVTPESIRSILYTRKRWPGIE